MGAPYMKHVVNVATHLYHLAQLKLPVCQTTPFKKYSSRTNLRILRIVRPSPVNNLEFLVQL